MEKIIPENLDKAIFMPLFGLDVDIEDEKIVHKKKKERTPETYIKELEKFEKKCEKSLIETLSRIGIDARVKTDRYSLPHQKEVVKILQGESYVNGPYEFHRVARDIVKELLIQDVSKIRFYILINIKTDGKGFAGMFGQIEYKFRYYIHY